MTTKKMALSALFICFAGALSALESMLPPIVPVTGVRVGLGNIVTLFILYIGGKWRGADALTVAVLRRNSRVRGNAGGASDIPENGRGNAL